MSEYYEDDYAFQERAAIMQYDGGLLKEDAERMAIAKHPDNQGKSLSEMFNSVTK